MIQSKSLLIFNLELDNDSLLLQSNVEWVRAFSKIYREIACVSTRAGLIPDDIKHVQIKELGGGKLTSRIIALLRLIKVLCQYAFKRDLHIFHHMSHRTVIFPGIFFKLLGRPQALWYSHKHKGRGLSLSTHIANIIFSPSIASYPIPNRKIIDIGQAIFVEKYKQISKYERYENIDKILSVGRVSPAKKLEALAQVKLSANMYEFDVIGPIQDSEYAQFLKKKYGDLGVRLRLMGSMHPNLLPKTMSRYNVYFTGTPAGVDRAAIEAAMCGCIVLSQNDAVVSLVGLKEVWLNMGIAHLDVESQLNQLKALDARERFYLAKVSQEFTRKNNNVYGAVFKIKNCLENLE